MDFPFGILLVTMLLSMSLASHSLLLPLLSSLSYISFSMRCLWIPRTALAVASTSRLSVVQAEQVAISFPRSTTLLQVFRQQVQWRVALTHRHLKN